MPVTPADAASIPKILADLKSLVETIEQSTDIAGDGGRKITGAEWAAIGKKLLAVAGDVLFLILL